MVSGTITPPSTGSAAPLPPTPTPPKGTTVVVAPQPTPAVAPVHLPGMTPAPATPAKRPMIAQPPVNLPPSVPTPAAPPPPVSWFKQPTPPMGTSVAASIGSGDKTEKGDKAWEVFGLIASVLTIVVVAFLLTMTRCDLKDIKDNQSEMKTDIGKIKSAVIASDSNGNEITVLTALSGLNTKIDGLAKKSDVEGLAKVSDIDGLSNKIDGLAKKSDVEGLAKVSDIDGLSNKIDGLAKKSDLRGLARKSDLDGLSANADLDGLATTTDIRNLNAKIDGLSSLALESNKLIKERANAKPKVVVVRAVQPKAKKVVKK
ncbi:MAG: hypothetical protein KBC69_00315 [Candidatus Magasanikbacteria bacterium]|nr:hypothetical protein [Candidatus Magasanikbacteria bacterium]